MKKNYNDLSLSAILGVISFVSRLVHAQTPGLHADEAFAGLQTNAIRAGDLKIAGMNNFTGPFFDYLRVPFFVFSQSIVSLRALSFLVSSLAVVALYFILRRYFEARASFIGALVFSLSVWFFLSSRIAWEQSFFPSITVLALFGLTSSRNIFKFLGAGLCGLVFWAHPLFITAILPLALLAIILDKSSRKIKSWAVFLLGFAVGVTPKIIQIALKGFDFSKSHQQTGITYKNFLTSAFSNLPGFFAGDIEYVRQFSKVNIPLDHIILILAGLVIIAGLFVAILKNLKVFWIVLALALAGLISIILTSYIVPWITYRYLLVPLTFLGLSVSFLSAELSNKKFLQCLPIALVAVFVFGWYVNFYQYPRVQTIKRFQYGTIEDTSAHFIDSKPLYDCLKKNFGSSQISAKIFIARILKFYDLNNLSLNISEVENEQKVDSRSLFVGYRDEKIPSSFTEVSTCSNGNFVVSKKN